MFERFIAPLSASIHSMNVQLKNPVKMSSIIGWNGKIGSTVVCLFYTVIYFANKNEKVNQCSKMRCIIKFYFIYFIFLFFCYSYLNTVVKTTILLRKTRITTVQQC